MPGVLLIINSPEGEEFLYVIFSNKRTTPNPEEMSCEKSDRGF